MTIVTAATAGAMETGTADTEEEEEEETAAIATAATAHARARHGGLARARRAVGTTIADADDDARVP
jgi:hypothetical protein